MTPPQAAVGLHVTTSNNSHTSTLACTHGALEFCLAEPIVRQHHGRTLAHTRAGATVERKGKGAPTQHVLASTYRLFPDGGARRYHRSRRLRVQALLHLQS